MNSNDPAIVALGIEYRGSAYCGWQRQAHSPSVQQQLEDVLARIADHPVKLYCAGRTDTGVHATGQVVHFELTNPRPAKAWLRGANTWLPDDISIRWVKEMPSGFHARHSAQARRYRYVIQNTVRPPAHMAGLVTWVAEPLDQDKMNLAAQVLLGEQDFSSFQAASCQSLTPFRFVENVSVKRWNEFVVIDITANAFLHHMVRNITGSLLEVGVGRESIDFIRHLMELKDRTKAATTAKPDGLYLVSVRYPQEFELNQSGIGPLLLPDQW